MLYEVITGIDLGEELKIFERYYQTSNKSKFNFGGTGIGLAYSKGVVELHVITSYSIHYTKLYEKWYCYNTTSFIFIDLN